MNGSILIPLMIGAVSGLIGVVVGSWSASHTIEIVRDLGTLLAAAAAMLTAIGTFLTVRQMQRQMEASYRPELTFARAFVKGEAESPELPLPTHWAEMPRFVENWSGAVTVSSTITLVRTPVVPGFYTNLYNIGLGAATNINIVWNFAVKDMVEEVNRLAQRTLTPAYYEYENDVLLLESETWSKTGIIWRNEQKDSLDYIMPENVNASGVTLRIPFTYTHLVSSYLYLWYLQKDNKQELEILPLEIKITYRDISGRHHQVSFVLRMHVSSMETPKDSTMTFTGRFEAEKVA